MEYSRFEKHMIHIVRMYKFYSSIQEIEPVLDIFEDAMNFGFIKEKIKYFLVDCQCGEKPNMYYIHNGRTPLILDSIKKLWIFIKD